MANELRVRQNFIGGLVDTIDLPAADTVVTDGVTNSTTTVTSATAAFTANDVGAPISGGSIPAGATIASFTNSTTVVISAAATASASGVSLTIGRSRNFYSAALSAIATAIGSTNHFPIVLDPDGLYGAPEVAYITSLTVGAVRAVISRGQEGTTARAHLLDTPWVHGPTVYDMIGDSAWATPTYQNSYVDIGSGVTTKYRKGDGDRVEIQFGTKAPNSSVLTAFTLPAGYRPGQTIWITVNLFSVTGAISIGAATITAAGVVQILDPSGNGPGTNVQVHGTGWFLAEG